jgi:amino acid adenylation domain-containing protein/FkbH-like protein
VGQTAPGYRLSPHQESFWAAARTHTQAGLNVCCALRCAGEVRAEAVRAAVRTSIARHEILRTVYVRQSGLKMPFQVILEDLSPIWRETDLSISEQQEAQLRELFESESKQKFDLESGPVVAAHWVTLAEQQHVLILCVSAMSADGGSLEVLARQIAGELQGGDEIREIMQYADVTEWQHGLIESQDEQAEQGRDYWKSPEPGVVLLPLERHPKYEFRPERIPVSVTQKQIAAISSLAEQLRVASEDVLFAAWQAFLFRMNGHVSPLVHRLFAGREYEEVREAIGLFARLLPMRADFDGGFRFEEVVQRAMQVRNEASEFQEYFIQEVPVHADEFAYPDWCGVERASGFSLGNLHIGSGAFRTKLLCIQNTERLALWLEYDAERFEHSTAERLARSFQTLLTDALADPLKEIAALNLVDQREREQILTEWNRTEREFPRMAAIHELFEMQVRRTPERPAVRCGERELSYAQLNAQAEQLARFLRTKAIGAGSIVAVLMERSVDLLVSIMAVMKAGGAYSALVPDAPSARLVQQLAGVRIVIVDESTAAKVPSSFEGEVIVFERGAWKASVEGDLGALASAEDLAYVIYTSGSTGVPKAVGVRHRNLVNYSTHICYQLQLRQGEPLQFATVSTLAADLGNTCIFPALISGSCVHLIPYEVATDARQFAHYQDEHAIDVVKIVPSHLEALLQEEEGARCLPRMYLMCGGEALTWGLVETVRATRASCEIFNHYGPTETTVGSLMLRLAEVPELTKEQCATVPVGRPIANTQAYVLDGRLQPVPIGVIGELYIAGEGVTAGYLGDAPKTAERFVDHPFVAGTKMYRTGDLARHLEGGWIEFLGRADDQVKIRGFRVEPGEVATVLSAQTGVKQAVVLAVESRLVAYVVPERGVALREEALRAIMKELLPDYMVPSAILVLDKIPLNANGKLDRKALPSPEESGHFKKEYVAPRTPTEEVVAGIWSEVLKRERVSVEDNFFDLGGHSLLATQVISRVRKLLDTELPLRAIFEAPTVRELAMRIEELRVSGDRVRPEIQPISRQGALPLSFAQQQLWLIQQMDPESHLYNVPRAIQLKGQLNIEALRSTLNEIVRRHEVLRTRFVAVNGEPVQVIESTLEIPLPMSEVASEEEAVRLAHQQYRKAFDLEKGPLLRARLIRIREENHVLAVIMHHIVSDGQTGGVFFAELGEIYQALVSGRDCPLPDLTVQYADYAAWQRGWLQGETLDKMLEFWRTELSGAPAMLDLPTDHARPGKPSYRGAMRSIKVGRATVDALKIVAQRNGATLFSALLAGLRVVLSQWSGQKDFTIGTVAGNRSHSEIEGMIGCFINFVPLRDVVAEDEAFEGVLSRTKQKVMDAFSYGDCPFEKIVEAVKPERRANVNPVYNVGLLMQNFPEFVFRSEALEAKFVDIELGVAFLDLRFVAAETAHGLKIDCEYSSDLFEMATIDLLLKGYVDVLSRCAATPSITVRELPIPDELMQQAEVRNKREQAITVAVTATFTAEPIEESVRFWMGELGMACDIAFAPYHQVFQQLLDPASLLGTNDDGYNVVLVRMEDWHRFDPHRDDRVQKIERNVEELIIAIRMAAKRSASTYIVIFCPASSELLAKAGWPEFMARMEERVAEELSDMSGVHVIPSAQLNELYPVSDYEDDYSDQLGHIPYTKEMFSALGTMIVRRIAGIRGPKYKVIVLDCDNTLWKGVCGEDGPQGVAVDEPRRMLQEFMLRQRDQGMLLCLCSKNAEEDVWQVLEQNPGMLIQREHLAAWRINWDAKSKNLQALAKELQLGIDSFVFIDDNPVECAEVEAECPEVLVLPLPEEIEKTSLLLKHVWAFDHFKLTDEDERRSEMYRENSLRESLRRESRSLDEFLAGLELVVGIEPLQLEQVSRVAQLTQRTNQFNTTTKRRTEAEIEAMLQPGGAQCLTVSLRDRFGDYGLIGVAVYEIAGNTIVVDSMMMSCRALGRRVEYAILARLGEIALTHGAAMVDIKFVPTLKNMPMRDFLESVVSACEHAGIESSIYRIPAAEAKELGSSSMESKQ